MDSWGQNLQKKKKIWGHEIKKWSKWAFFDLWILTKNFIKLFFLFIYIYIYDFFFQQKTKKNYQKNWSHPHYKWGKKSFFFMSGIKNGRISTIWKTFKKCLFLLNFLLNPSLLSQKITKKIWKKKMPFLALFLAFSHLVEIGPF